MSQTSAELLRTAESPTQRQRVRKSTSHLKLVPEELATRELIKSEAARFADTLDRARPFTKVELESWGRELLERLGFEEKYLGFTMVLIGDFFWKEQFLAIPFEKRMLLLPHCLKHAEGCPAEYDELGLNCESCGACSIADYKTRAEQLGYKVLVAEGTPIVLKLLVSGRIDAVLGVACLNVLEKAIDKILLAGVPSYAIPLHSGDCKNTRLDEAWVWEVLDQYQPLQSATTYSYLPLLRSANELFDEHFERLLPRVRSNGQADPFQPLVETEKIAYDFLAKGGKRFRPFVTLAAYDAIRRRQSESGHATPVELHDHVQRAAMAIEAFHKASLIHDDIEDDDLYRYGQTTLHRRYDISTAINVGDYLIGLGYRLVSRDRKALGIDVAADIIDHLGDAHVKLCEGQGAELRWRQASDKSLKPIDAMKIYALKTAPAFEAALYCGLRLAGTTEKYDESVSAFCRHLGVGFQILNDLKDWTGDDNNKLVAGQDALAMRPTLLLALALESAGMQQRSELMHMLERVDSENGQMNRLRQIYNQCAVFEKAERLLEKSRERAEQIADRIEPDSLRQLFYFLVDTVLAPETDSQPTVNPESLPIVSIT